eukprot:gene9092-4783_t
MLSALSGASYRAMTQAGCELASPLDAAGEAVDRGGEPLQRRLHAGRERAGGPRPEARLRAAAGRRRAACRVSWPIAEY